MNPATGAALQDELLAYDRRDLLRFITCGSVDDGKSTLIGRLLYDCKMIADDHLDVLSRESKTIGTQKGDLDFALLVDGLAAEREQGITIDVAYRYFSTRKRSFIIADTPGHEQYTRNMITGASSADLAVILVDARKGILPQTRRHSFIVALMGVRHVVLAVNKMDLVGHDRAVFDRICDEYHPFARELGITNVVAIPVSALSGANVASRAADMAWYAGPALIEHLETVEVARDLRKKPFRVCVQWISRPDSEFRGYAGLIASGETRVGDPVLAAPSGKDARISRILVSGVESPQAVAGQSVIFTLDREIDVARGDVLCSPSHPPGVADQFNATIIWMGDDALFQGRPYLIKVGAKTLPGTITDVRHKVDVTTLEHLAAKTVGLNEIARVNIQLAQAIAFDPYEQNRDTGGFIIIDRATNATIGAGLIHFALHRSQSLQWQNIDVDKPSRARLKGHKPCVLWLTGLSGAGKSTIANAIEKKLFAAGRHTYLLDGDNMRHGLNRDLGFTEADRVENVRRVAEVSKLMVDAGLIVLVSFISPFRAERNFARSLFQPGEFLEVYVDTPLAIAEKRDPKGLYARARRGEIANFTGISSPYEPPLRPDLHIDTTRLSADEAADLLLRRLEENGIFRSEDEA